MNKEDVMFNVKKWLSKLPDNTDFAVVPWCNRLNKPTMLQICTPEEYKD